MKIIKILMDMKDVAAKLVKPTMFDHKEEYLDYFVQIKNLRKGDVFYECSESGENYELRVVENPKKTGEGWFCLVETLAGDILDFFVSANTSYKKINLFWAPIHLSQLESGEYAYVIR